MAVMRVAAALAALLVTLAPAAAEGRAKSRPILLGVLGGTILALLAGISRSGVTMVGGLWRGLSHEDAARFSFLLGTPIIFAAAALEIPQLIGQSAFPWTFIILGTILSGVAAYLSTKFLMKYFETGRLNPFSPGSTNTHIYIHPSSPNKYLRVAVPIAGDAGPTPAATTPPAPIYPAPISPAPISPPA